jgi:hypothetical protein
VTTRVVRILVGGAGAAAAAYGVMLLLSHPDWVVLEVLRWLVAGVIAHDAVLAPLTVLVTALGVRLLPRRVRGPVAAGLVVLATVTLTAVPVLLSRGARPDNPTLLDRNYGQGWLVFAGAVALGVILSVLLRRGGGRAGTRPSHDGPGEGA